MLRQEIENRSQIEFFCVDEFVPQDHLLRKIDKVVDFSYIYELVKDLYCADNGRPSCDPVVLFKMVLIQHIYGIPLVSGLYYGREDSTFCDNQL